MNTRSPGVQTADAKLYRLPFANSSMKRLPCLVQTHWMNLLCDPTHMVAKFTNCSRSDASVRMFVAFVGLARTSAMECRILCGTDVGDRFRPLRTTVIPTVSLYEKYGVLKLTWLWRPWLVPVLAPFPTLLELHLFLVYQFSQVLDLLVNFRQCVPSEIALGTYEFIRLGI